MADRLGVELRWLVDGVLPKKRAADGEPSVWPLHVWLSQNPAAAAAFQDGPWSANDVAFVMEVAAKGGGPGGLPLTSTAQYAELLRHHREAKPLSIVSDESLNASLDRQKE